MAIATEQTMTTVNILKLQLELFIEHKAILTEQEQMETQQYSKLLTRFNAFTSENEKVTTTTG